MTYISYRAADGSPLIGELVGESVVPLIGIGALGPGTGTAELAAAVRDQAGAFPVAEAEPLPASVLPSKVFCVGLNYLSHVEETKRDLPTYPVLFPKWASSLIAQDQPIALPPESSQVDWEGELAVIIGAPGRRITEEHAFDHVLGYAVANDITMRDFQYKTHQWLQGKAWDASTPLGAVIATPDDVEIGSAGIRTLLNGETVQESDLSRLIFPIPRLIALVSEFTELQPGDVILTGTPSGVGYRRDPQVFLAAGDRVVVEIDGVGRIESDVVAG